jgi:hypothetical protein
MKVALLLLAMLSSSGISFAQTVAQSPAAHWYDNAVIYEIYPRSFQDSNGDGSSLLR